MTTSIKSKFTCLCCRIKLDSLDLQRDHFKTEWHLFNLKRRVHKLDPVDLNNFETIQSSMPEKSKDDDDETWEYVDRIDSHNKSLKSEDEDDDDDESWETVDEEDEEEVKRMLDNVIKTDTCLFCAKKSKNINQNLEHMHRHGFFLPEAQYLVDLQGMLTYLGYKVGAGSTCLWCNKQFKSLHGARLHMIYKDHCKICYDHEKAVEYSEFYDYSNQERIEMKPISQLAIPQRRRVDRPLQLQVGQTKHSALVQNQTITNKSIFVKRRMDKIVLRTGIQNNETMRSRLRKQCPI